MSYFAHVQDFVDAYVGPFATTAECDAHVAATSALGASFDHIANVTDDALPADAFTILPADAFTILPADDLAACSAEM